ncbi:S49 family peptidase [Pseudooceanicola sp. MF1-13]|uniref:S49 family peptidase n=1 Tax=Pseudooceanicola sp. MF1-13 TaxID=3379095 RepID=UPI003891EBA7
MTDNTVRAAIGQEPVALCMDHAAQLLALQVTPDAAAGQEGPAAQDSGGVRIERGERFAIHRGVGIVPVSGVLTPNAEIYERFFGWATYAGLANSVTELAANEDVGAIVLVMDTPGGLVLGIQMAAEAIAAARAVKPVHILVKHMALSAGYWLASQGSDITVTPGSWVGSIGVAVTTHAFVQPGVSSGVQFFDLSSTHARAKLPNASTDEGRAEIQRRLDQMESNFHAAVAAGRNIPLTDLTARLSVTDDPRDGGALFWGQEAIDRGLADRAETDVMFWSRMFDQYSPRPQAGRGKSARVSAAAARAGAAAAKARAAI